MEVPSSSLQIARAHHVVTVLELSAGLKASLLDLLLLLHHVQLVDITLSGKHAGLGCHLSSQYLSVLPLDLELGNSGLLDQNMSGQLGDVRLFRGVLGQLRVLIIVVDVVADTEKFLIGIGACH